MTKGSVAPCPHCGDKGKRYKGAIQYQPDRFTPIWGCDLCARYWPMNKMDLVTHLREKRRRAKMASRLDQIPEG